MSFGGATEVAGMRTQFFQGAGNSRASMPAGMFANEVTASHGWPQPNQQHVQRATETRAQAANFRGQQTPAPARMLQHAKPGGPNPPFNSPEEMHAFAASLPELAQTNAYVVHATVRNQRVNVGAHMVAFDNRGVATVRASTAEQIASVNPNQMCYRIGNNPRPGTNITPAPQVASTQHAQPQDGPADLPSLRSSLAKLEQTLELVQLDPEGQRVLEAQRDALRQKVQALETIQDSVAPLRQPAQPGVGDTEEMVQLRGQIAHLDNMLAQDFLDDASRASLAKNRENLQGQLVVLEEAQVRDQEAAINLAKAQEEARLLDESASHVESSSGAGVTSLLDQYRDVLPHVHYLYQDEEGTQPVPGLGSFVECLQFVPSDLREQFLLICGKMAQKFQRDDYGDEAKMVARFWRDVLGFKQSGRFPKELKVALGEEDAATKKTSQRKPRKPRTPKTEKAK